MERMSLLFKLRNVIGNCETQFYIMFIVYMHKKQHRLAVQAIKKCSKLKDMTLVQMGEPS